MTGRGSPKSSIVIQKWAIQYKCFGNPCIHDIYDSAMASPISKHPKRTRAQVEQVLQDRARLRHRNYTISADVAHHAGAWAKVERIAAAKERAVRIYARQARRQSIAEAIARQQVAPNAIDEYYQMFQLSSTATVQDVKKAFRALMRKHHPDLHAMDPESQQVSSEISKQITRAYHDLLSHLK